MGKSALLRRCAVWVVLAVVPGLLAVSPVLADPAAGSQEPPSGVPTLSLPEEADAPLPESLPVDGRLALPEDASAPVPAVSQRSKEGLPEPDHEVVAGRDAVTEVWQNADGTQTITIHEEPVHYQPAGSSVWEEIDNSLVPVADRAGWVQNAANDWSVRFGPVQPGGVGGVEVVTDAGVARFAPELEPSTDPIAPVVGTGDNDDTVTYPEVWPGVDVVYTVTGGRVKEDIVVRGDGRAEFPFVTEGLGLVEDGSGSETAAVEVTGPQGAEFAIAPVEVVDAEDQLAGADAEADLGVEAPASGDGVVNTPVVGTPQRLTVSVDAGWLADETAGDGQVVIDPTGVVLSAFDHTAFKSDGYSCTGCGIKVGNSQGGAGGAPTYWRTAGGYNYWSSIAGKQVLYAGVWMGRDSNTQSSAAQTVSIYWATGSSYVGAIANEDTSRKIATATMGDSYYFDVTSTVQGWQYFGLQNELFGFSGAETTCTQATAACYTYRSSGASLVLNVNSPPSAPALVAPANDSLAITSLTPTLKWNPVTDPDASDTVKYTAMIATGADAQSGMVATGPEGTATTWQVPAGVLRDGVTYYWKVYANDGTAWTASAIRKLTVNRSGVAPPTDEYAGVSTNLITGNSSVGVSGPTMPTVSGGIGVSLSYETQPQPTGLMGEYRIDEDQDHVIESSDDVVLARTDSQVSFNWSGSAPSPSQGVPSEYYTAKWTGTIALPDLGSGTWQIGARSDDGVRVWIDNTLVVDQWQTRNMPATPDYQTGSNLGDLYDIRVEYFQSTGAAGVELWARKAATPTEASVVPAEWLASEPRVLPKGWRLDTSVEREYARAEVSDGSVTLVRPDGTAISFPATPLNFGYTPPKGNNDVVVVNHDGTVMVHADSGNDYLFGIDGSLKEVTSAIEDQDTSAATQATYDSSGRVATLTDPVSEQPVTLAYAPSSGCEEDPPILGGSSFEPAPTGFLCKVTYWDGTTTQLYYKNGLLGYVRNPGNAYWGYSYDTSRRLNAFHDSLVFDTAMSGARTDWDLLTTTLGYDTSGRVSNVTQPPALQGDPRPAMTYAYAPAVNSNAELTGGTAAITRAGITGTYRSVGYDARGRKTSDTDAAGLVTTTTYDTEDQVTRTDEPGGLRSTTIYDEEDQPIHDYGPAPAAQFNADGTGQAGVPHEATNYDEGITGLAVAWWNNGNFTGSPTLHQHDPGSLDSDWGTGSPAAGAISNDDFSGRYTGNIVFPDPGTYTLRLERDNRLAFYIDDSIRIFDWANTAAGNSPETTVEATADDESHRIRIDYGETTGSAKLKLQWKTPGSSTWATVPASALRSGYGFVTTSIPANGIPIEYDYTDSASALDTQHGVPTSTSTDPSGLNLIQTTRYETEGHRRPVAEVMPSGSVRTLAYYGDTETRDNPCTAANDPANQAGRQKLETAADPDGTGSQTPIVREAVYDVAGRAVATRVGTEPWTCATYDNRGRPVETNYPAFGGSAARTVTYDFSVDPDGSGARPESPLVVTVSDLVGTIFVEADLLGQPAAHTDVFGNTTTFTFDQVGRQISSSGPVGLMETTYDAADRITTLKRNGQVLANGLTYNSAGQMTGVTYPAGTGTAGNGTSGTFGYDTLGRPSTITWAGPGGSITSDAVTRKPDGAIKDQMIDGVDHHAGDDFVYDAAGRLVDAWVPGARYQYGFQQFAYCTAPDSYKNTNRTTMTVTPTGGAPTTTLYCYDHADRLNTSSDANVGTVGYDGHGNTTTVFGEAHAYDAVDRHVSTTKSNTTITYIRDATDRIVQRQINGTTTARYGYSASGDAPTFVTDGTGTLLSVTYSLPGGVLLSTDMGSGNSWSYPNIHGDIVTTTNQAGVKQGTTTIYDPYGSLIAGPLPDNSPGDLDNAWLGQHHRLLEHETPLQPVVEMGARQYSALVGRFLQVDPVVGGSANDYDYAKADPCNNVDINGTKFCPTIYVDHGRAIDGSGLFRVGFEGGSKAIVVTYILTLTSGGFHPKIIIDQRTLAFRNSWQSRLKTYNSKKRIRFSAWLDITMWNLDHCKGLVSGHLN